MSKQGECKYGVFVRALEALMFDILATLRHFEEELDSLSQSEIDAVAPHNIPTPGFDVEIPNQRWSEGAQKILALHCRKYLESKSLIDLIEETEPSKKSVLRQRLKQLNSEGTLLQVLLACEFGERFPQLADKNTMSPSVGPNFGMYMSPVGGDPLDVPLH